MSFKYRYLDGGPDLGILAAPTVAIAANGTRPKHAVDVTISALPAGTSYELQLKLGSDPWEFYRDGTANETIVVQNLPSGTTIQARARTAEPNRIRSPWSSAVSQATTALTAPSGVSAVATNTTIELIWTNGEADELLQVTLDGTDHLNLPLEAGSTRYVFTELAPSTLFTLGVKYIDPYGGESTLVTDTATTGTAATLSAPRQLTILQGAPAADTVHPTWYVFGGGVELGWTRTESHAVVEMEVDDNSGFTSPTLHRGWSTLNTLKISLPMNDTLQYFRARQVREGWTASAWTPTVSAKPVPLAATASVADGFAGGFASLSLDTDDDVILNVGTEDADTDTAYFELNNTGFVEPTTGSSSIASSAMPYSQDQGLILGAGDTAYLWLKFHNAIKGFGQGVKHQLTIGVVQNTTFRQASAPTAIAIGDIWIDSDDDDRPYRWTGVVWLDIGDVPPSRLDVGAGTITGTMTLQDDLTMLTGNFTFGQNTGSRVLTVDRGGEVLWRDSGQVSSGRITGGTSARLIVELGDFHIGNALGLVVGHPTQVALAGTTPELQVLGTGAADSTVAIGRWSNDVDAPLLGFYKSRHATIGSLDDVVTGDNIGQIIAFGDDGTDADTRSSGILFDSEGTIATGAVPGVLRLQTAAAGTLTDAITINSVQEVTIAKHVGIGGSVAGVQALVVGEAVTGTGLAFFQHSHATAPLGIQVQFSGGAPDDNSQWFYITNDTGATRSINYSDGDFWTADAGTLTSDETLKENIKTTTPKLADVLALDVINFNWTDEYHTKGAETQTRKRIGYRAQQVENIFPGLVQEHNVGPRDQEGNPTTDRLSKSVRMGMIGAPILVKAFQEYVGQTDGRIATLQTRLDALEAAA